MPTATASSPAYKCTNPGIFPLPNSTLTRFSNMRMSCIRSYIQSNLSLLISMRRSLLRMTVQDAAGLHSMKTAKGKQKGKIQGIFSERGILLFLGPFVTLEGGEYCFAPNRSALYEDWRIAIVWGFIVLLLATDTPCLR